MSLIPDPLHPAVVHFPIVLLLLGAGAAVAGAVWRRAHLPHIAAALLVLGAVGAWVAVETGESAGGLLETGSAARDALLDAHQLWAERTAAAALLAAVIAVAAVAAGRWPRLARGLGAAASLAALGAAWAVVQTGHRGGALVYRHGAGVAAAFAAAEPDRGVPAAGRRAGVAEPESD